MNFEENIILENDRVLLRPLEAADLAHLIVFANNEPDLWTYSLTPANGEPNMTAYINAALKDRAEKKAYAFIVFDKKTKKYIGSTRFYDFQKTHATTQLGYTWYGKAFWSTGVNKNCKFLMLQYAFEHLMLKRVEFRADNMNERSIAAMKSIGCIPEGVLRSNCASETGRRDSIVLSILIDEWQNKVKQNLHAKISKGA